MRKETIHRVKTNQFSKQQIDLSYHQEELSQFLTTPFSIEAFPEIISSKEHHFTSGKRELLVNSLTKQYESVQNKDLVSKQIEALLNSSTFTITTGHQLSLLTGPLYFIYKILHVIRLSEELNQRFTENHFVPVYWMAAEDHDFEEIQSMSLFNKSITWESQQKGPVGRFDLEGLTEVKKEVSDLFANQPDSEVHEFINQLDGSNYASAFRNLIHWLFGKYGLVIIDGDDADLKASFLPIMEKELSENFSSQAVEITNDLLLKNNLKTQINAREVNLFYIEKGLRERIIRNEDHFSIAGKGNFSKTELLALLHQSPESFSPNVVLRPVYQESVLPNLCYVGGTGELTYWLQLKGVFDAIEIPYPLLQVRNSILWIDKATQDKMEKVNVKLDDLFKDLHQLHREFVIENSEETIDFSQLDARFKELENELISSVIKIEPHLEKYGRSEVVRMEKQLQSIKDKLFKTEKQKHESSLKNMEQIKERLFPNGSLQERSVNFLQLVNQGDIQSKITQLKEAIDPFENDFIVLFEE